MNSLTAACWTRRKAGFLMTYRGHIRGNIVVLETPTDLPDGALVIVEPAPLAPAGEPELPSMLERLGEFVGCMEGLPEDFADNHDHYIHGTPKRNP